MDFVIAKYFFKVYTSENINEKIIIKRRTIMKEVRTEIEINAPKEKVWDILTNFDGWGEWNPTVKEAKGEAKLKSTLTITMRGKTEEGAHSYSPVIINIDAPNSFRFRASMGARIMMTNYKTCQLEETAKGVKLIHIEGFTGLMVPIIWKKMEKGVPMMLDMMNKALKKKAES